MAVKQTLPIGMDDFREMREGNFYYVDKTRMIKDFIELRDKVALITRPRRFGKTLNMTMIRDFFDIAQDSREIYDGLAIMDTEYAGQINSRPVIYLTFKDCKGANPEQMFEYLKTEFYREYRKFEKVLRDKITDPYDKEDFYTTLKMLQDQQSVYRQFGKALLRLTQIVKAVYEIAPILLIDEYDQPVVSSYERGYHDQLGDFFSNLYGSAMKSNPALGHALLTGVQRVAKESIFSQFNNVKVYTVLHKQYAPYFGLTEGETARLLTDYGATLDKRCKKNIMGIVLAICSSIIPGRS